jgi:hypothetical protein
MKEKIEKERDHEREGEIESLTYKIEKERGPK